MALEDFLGSTSEIKIIDFLAENMDNSYNQTELSEFTDQSRTTINKKIPELIHNNILEIREEIGKLKTYQLADNDIVKMLIAATLKHSFKQAENLLDEEEAKEEIYRKIGIDIPIGEPNRFYKGDLSYHILLMDNETSIIPRHGKIQTFAMASA